MANQATGGGNTTDDYSPVEGGTEKSTSPDPTNKKPEEKDSEAGKFEEQGTDDKQQDNDVEEKKSKEEQNISDSDASSDGLNKE